MRSRWVGLVVTGCVLTAVLAYARPSPKGVDLPILEVEMKGHLADSFAASSYDLSNLRVNPADNHLQILLTAFENERDGHYLLRLKDGDSVATIPYFPIYGNLYVSRSAIQELDLRFYNFAEVTPDKRSDMTKMANAVATSPEQDVSAIIQILDILNGFGWTAFKGHCYKNRFPDDDPIACPDKLVFDPSTGDSFDHFLNQFIADMALAHRANDFARWDQLNGAVMGGWAMNDGTLVRATVEARFDPDLDEQLSLSQRPFQLALHLNFFSQYAAIRANILSSCFPLFGEDAVARTYTPREAQIIFDGLYGLLGDPVLGDTMLVDELLQERFAWGLERLTDDLFRSVIYYTSRAWDRHFSEPRDAGGVMRGRLTLCNHVSHLEADAGYTAGTQN